ncbi:MAG: M24 family metallopeptidase [Bryobacteraceae bacterium]
MQIGDIQRALADAGLDGWLFYDHHERDPLAYRILGFSAPRTPTRRWYYLIPASGEPKALVHRIEPGMLDAVPGARTIYSSWQTQLEGLRAMLTGRRRVAMQYSPKNAVPYVSMVDAGTVEVVRDLGVEVVTSADLIQIFEARWSAHQLETHREAGRRVDAVRRSAFEEIAARLRGGLPVTEFDIKTFILTAFERDGLFTDHGPIVGVNENAANPHYEPTAELHKEIARGDVVLIDLWAKLAAAPDAVYYDITWTGFTGAPPADVENVFGVVTGARDAAIRFVREGVAAGTEMAGYQVDDAARGHIAAAGYGDWFVHRTGHSIGRDVHGTGANMDNLETHDERRLIAGTCFSIEPGIYLDRFGIRSEVDMYVGERNAEVTGEIQRALVRIE